MWNKEQWHHQALTSAQCKYFCEKHEDDGDNYLWFLLPFNNLIKKDYIHDDDGSGHKSVDFCGKFKLRWSIMMCEKKEKPNKKREIWR